MVSSLIYSLEPYVTVLYFIHAVVSLIFAVVLSKFIAKRFVTNTKEVQLKDKYRLEEITNESLIFKLLFRVALHKNNQITTIIFIFLFNISIPIVGYIFSIWIIWYLKSVSYEKKVAHTNILNLDEFEFSFLKIERIFGEGSMSELMINKYAPKSKKLKALSALANNLSPANLKIIRQSLSSTDDEIRMFGYAIINKAEKVLNQKINKYLDILYLEAKRGDEKDDELVAESAKELAFLYWEMVYTELSHESLKNNFLNSCIAYIELAREYYISEVKGNTELIKEYETQNRSEMNENEVQEINEKIEIQQQRLHEYYKISSHLYMLMGRVYMQRKEYESAKAEFTVAQELLPDQASFILPYLAEVYYLTGKYDIVGSIMNKASDLELNATLYPISNQWKYHNVG
ncbi:MAG: hypothetical protein U9O83_05520 [Campylobacterota bacterium]|nr:hypothetical protein [Campylobacterota bacterium]